MFDEYEILIKLPVSFIDALSNATSIEDVLTVATRALPRLISSDFGVVTFLDETDQISRAYHHDGETGAFGHDIRIFPGSNGAKVLETGQEIFLNEDDLAKVTTGLMKNMYQAGVKSVLIAPMKSGATTVGVLSIASKNSDGFSAKQATFLIAVGKWIASQARLMQQARHTARLAETDALTGLANRARLMRVLDGPGVLDRPDSMGRIVGVLHIDLDHFKEVNDTFGHSVGDAILRHAAKSMCAAVSAKDLVARTGGDEFIVVTRTDPGGQQLIELAHKIISSISVPVRTEEVEARVGVSIGTAMADGPGCTADHLIGNADIALYEVKRNGRGGVHVYSGEMRAKTERRVRLLADMQDAVAARNFEPYFQPQVSLKTGIFTGFEMLARWPHPELGLVDPGDFIELAVEAGLSEQIDTIVRSKGLLALRRLRADGWDAPKMSFNASARTLADPDLVGTLMWEVLGQGLKPTDLVLEVRESDLVNVGGENALDNINALSNAGFQVELDDFGAGYAALSTLSRLSISAIKLDGTLIEALPAKRAETVLRAVIALAHQLNFGVVAEGVETAWQFSLLRQLGCNTAQGFGVSRPLSFDELVAFMNGYGRAPIGLAVGQN